MNPFPESVHRYGDNEDIWSYKGVYEKKKCRWHHGVVEDFLVYLCFDAIPFHFQEFQVGG